MSGYKSTVIEDDAASLWSFDGDSYDESSRVLIVPAGSPKYIIDEIDNLNPAILQTNSTPTQIGYRMGMSSLVEHEMQDQRSMSFGYNRILC